MTGADNLAMLGRAIGALIVVLVLIALIARVARRRAGRADGSGLRVVQRLGLSREANLAVIEVSNRTLLLGVTAQGVTMLADLDDDAGRGADEPAIQVASVASVASEAEVEVLSTPRELPARPGPTRLDLTGLERGTTAAASTPDFSTDQDADDVPAGPSGVRGPGSRPRSASPVGNRQPGLQEISGPVPNGIAMQEYPDLAAALRAAGRTTSATDDATDSATDRTADRTGDRAGSTADTAVPAAPRTRAEARAQGALTSSSGNTRARTRKPKQKAPKPGELKVTRIDDAGSGTAPTAGSTVAVAGKGSAGTTPVGRGAKAPAASRVQASGSVLSPRTWRQGVDALRELTVRRG